MQNKYLGKNFNGWLVINSYRNNAYPADNSDEKKQKASHYSYMYTLINSIENKKIHLSGNSLRLVDSGKRTIESIMQSKKKKTKYETLFDYLRRFLD